jgi:hypothetical protein
MRVDLDSFVVLAKYFSDYQIKKDFWEPAMRQSCVQYSTVHRENIYRMFRGDN